MTTGQNAPRHWQNLAHEKVRQGWAKDPDYRALIAACPGAGKTRCAVQISDELHREDIVELTLVLSPTVNIQRQWVEEFSSFGIVATCNADNSALRWRQKAGSSMREDKAAIVVTYAQLSRDPELFSELVRRHKTLLIADEVHHADEDETFGIAINAVRENVVHSLALSGTPFNSVGGSLALCECVADVNEEGETVQRTKETFSYSFAEAIDERVCRTVEFAKVEGTGRVTLRSLTDQTLFERMIKTGRKSDPIGLMLGANGEYMSQCIRSALDHLLLMRNAGDKRAAMLVVAKSIDHGNQLISAIERIKQEKAEWSQFSNIQEIYNDTEKAHERISSLARDNTDIIVSVRIISEGVDIKRLRVGLFATNTLTRMFFIQFVGRFIRYETRSPLDDFQHAVIVCPAHPDLMRWTLEIERMILANQIKLAIHCGPVPPRNNEFVDVETNAGPISLTYRGEENEYERNIIKTMHLKSSVFMSLPDTLVIKAARDLGISASISQNKEGTDTPINWRDRNNNIVKQIVRIQRANGDDDAELFRQANRKANSYVGIPTMDSMTPEAVVKKRFEFLQNMLRNIVKEQNPNFNWEAVDETNS